MEDLVKFSARLSAQKSKLVESFHNVYRGGTTIPKKYDVRKMSNS